jgi:hypothetical protein
MDNTRKPFILLIAISLIIISVGGVILWNLPKLGKSSGIPQGFCSVKALLLDVSVFPANTTMSSDEGDEDLAWDTASRAFINQSDAFDAYQYVEYYGTPFLAWQTYRYNYGIFKEDKYSGPWTTPNEITSPSQIADQYHFACSNNTEFGHQCMLTARYGRYFVFFRVNMSEKFTVEDIDPLLQEIDARMSPCNHK